MDLSGVVLDTSTYLAAGVILINAAATIWAVVKVYYLLRK